ncbi:hypothetical protein C6W26_14775 [Bacillus halotolerans]|nr:hypothetical protein C6W26_14775 [Bacillus halotolerans]PRS23334.1 hypothetical protein C6W25_06630 [Bacillus halotolerans]
MLKVCLLIGLKKVVIQSNLAESGGENDADTLNGLHAASVFLRTVVWEVSQNVLNGNNVQTFFLFPINITHSWLHGLTFILTLFLGAIILLSSSSSDYWHLYLKKYGDLTSS